MKPFSRLVFSFIGLSLAGQAPQKPRVEIVSPMAYDGEGKQYQISEPLFAYPDHYKSFEEIDANNFVVHTFEGKRHLVCGQLRSGYWKDQGHIGMESLRLLKTYRLPSSEAGAEFLLAIIEYFGAGGSSDSSRDAQVWKLKDGQLSIERQINYNTHFDGHDAYEKYSPRDQELVVRASHYLPGDAHCCISAYDELTLGWNGSEYVLRRIETKRVLASSEGNSSKKN